MAGSELLTSAPYGSEIVAEGTPDAETLFEEAGFKLGTSGRWLDLGASREHRGSIAGGLRSGCPPNVAVKELNVDARIICR